MYSETFISTANKVISFNIKLGQCLGHLLPPWKLNYYLGKIR